MNNKEGVETVRKYWDDLWRDDLKHDQYYANHDIDNTTDGISHLVYYALRGCNNGESIVEIGSGPGTRSIPIAKELGLRLTLVDILSSAHQLAIPRAKRYGYRVSPIQADALHLSIKNEIFDYVISIGLNEHFFKNDRQHVFDEHYRITKPGGRTIVIVPNKLNPAFEIEAITKNILGKWTFGPSDFFSPMELDARMKQSGYKKVELVGVSYLTSPIRVFPRQLQRAIYSDHKGLWSQWTHSFGNLDVKNPLNRIIGEEIMAIGYR